MRTPGPAQSQVGASQRAFVALGANLGAAEHTLSAALAALGALPHTQLVRHSSLYRSAPVDASGPDFLNAVAAIDTGLSADALLTALQQIEWAHGRERSHRNAPRTLDLDLLFYGDLHIDSEHLTLPHPRWRERAFVLLPLAEIAPARVAEVDRQRVTAQRIEKCARPWGQQADAGKGRAAAVVSTQADTPQHGSGFGTDASPQNGASS